MDEKDFESRHHLTFDTHEEGKISLDVFLDRTIFYKPRDFTHAEVRKFVSDFAEPLPSMVDLFKKIKAKHKLRIAIVSNEGRELTFD